MVIDSESLSEASADELIELLQSEWGRVHISYLGPNYHSGKQCSVRNVTDEGLPASNERKEVSGETLTDALETACRKYVTQTPTCCDGDE